jgi:hypothetical protein
MHVTFTWERKEHSGELKPISGAGNVFHLKIRNYYQGQLVRTTNGWQFITKKLGYIPELADHFGVIVEKSAEN